MIIIRDNIPFIERLIQTQQTNHPEVLPTKLKWPKYQFTNCLIENLKLILDVPMNAEQLMFIIDDGTHRDAIAEYNEENSTRVDQNFLRIKAPNNKDLTLRIVLRKINNWFKKYIDQRVNHYFLEHIVIDHNRLLIYAFWGS